MGTPTPIRSGQSVYRAHSEQAVVAHACHGHRYRPSPNPLSGTGKEMAEGVRGTAYTGGYKQSDRNR